jgi:hypothetical protein
LVFGNSGVEEVQEISDEFSWDGVKELPLESLEDDHLHGADLLGAVSALTGITSVLESEDKAFFELRG